MDLIERVDSSSNRHPWEIARFRFFLQLLHRMGVDRMPIRWLDVGAGDAWFAGQLVKSLPAAAQIVCWDINYSATDLALLTQDQGGLTFVAEQPHDHFGGVLMLDVIEHIHDDLGLVRDVVDNALDEQGWALVSVPAYQSLFTSHDTALRHYRRYSPRQCTELLRAAGLSVEAQGGLFHALLPVRGFQAVRERLSKQETSQSGIGAWKGGPLMTKAVTFALGSETRLSLMLGVQTNIVFPGLSFWAFCRRTGVDRRG
ncbi:MAG TPA: methyltransferase domain-containing protein [Acidimicrobiales bacterium]|nr:methyltransferase domain-containing protein [Acidimicrobiales bacterium]